jgi:hypothetical protein
MEPAPTERPRANSHTLPAQSPATLDNNAETIKNAGGAKDPGVAQGLAANPEPPSGRKRDARL